MTIISLQYMTNIVLKVSKDLVNMADRTAGTQGQQPSLRFPSYRDGRERVSEQESKILLAHQFLTKGTPFSIEVPTASIHSFSGQKELSARFDMATYGETESFDWVIELKAHNPEPSSIKKDFEKMVLAGCNCLWFHTLKNENSGTLPSLLGKMKVAFEEVCRSRDNMNQSVESRWIMAFVVLEKRSLYMTSFTRKELRQHDLSPFLQIGSTLRVHPL
ncbi:MAG: hypothetical protein EOM02_06880 [Synergistales bacterium]|nr:hypothetical protein [Synergistales bacterium]